MFERFAAPARTAVNRAMAEAHRRGNRRIGTDDLLLGLLHDPYVAETLGTTVQAARDAARTLDQQALAAIGIDISDFPLGTAIRPGPRTPLTSGSRQTLQRALRYTVAAKDRRIQTTHLLRALLDRDLPDPAVALITELGIPRGCAS